MGRKDQGAAPPEDTRGHSLFAAPSQRRGARREQELATKKLGLAAALGERASKDSADAAVYGVLPSAKVPLGGERFATAQALLIEQTGRQPESRRLSHS